MSNETTTLNVNCAAALDEYHRRVNWCERWDTLIFLFGTAVVGFLIIAILFLLRESYLSGAISTLGTIVSGAGIQWVQSRRKESRLEWNIAKEELKNNCPEVSSPQSLAGAGALIKRNPLIIVAAIFICVLWVAPTAFFAYQVNETKAVKASAEFALGNQLREQLADATRERADLKSKLEATNNALAAVTKDRDEVKSKLEATNNALAAVTKDRDEKVAQLKNVTGELDTLRGISFTIRLDTFNNQSADFPLTMNDLVTLRGSRVLAADFNRLPGFNDNKGIARRL